MFVAGGAALVCSAPVRANAHGLGNLNRTYVPVGVNVGYSLNRSLSPNNGGLLGLEASVVDFYEGRWYGAYADAVVDFASDEVRCTLGPELGLAILGIDGGYLFTDSPQGTQHGFVVRPMFAFGWVTAYTRFGIVLTPPKDKFGEVGLLLKFPLWESGTY